MRFLWDSFRILVGFKTDVLLFVFDFFLDCCLLFFEEEGPGTSVSVSVSVSVLEQLGVDYKIWNGHLK